MSNLQEKKQANILLVEDNPAEARLIGEALRECSSRCVLHVARNGQEAIDLLREGNVDNNLWPDLILLDLNLPRKSGKELLAEIRNDDGLRNLTVVILSVSRSEKDILECYRLRANSYVIKPMDYPGLLKVIAGVEGFWLSSNGVKDE